MAVKNVKYQACKHAWFGNAEYDCVCGIDGGECRQYDSLYRTVPGCQCHCHDSYSVIRRICGDHNKKYDFGRTYYVIVGKTALLYIDFPYRSMFIAHQSLHYMQIYGNSNFNRSCEKFIDMVMNDGTIREFSTKRQRKSAIDRLAKGMIDGLVKMDNMEMDFLETISFRENGSYFYLDASEIRKPSLTSGIRKQFCKLIKFVYV